jgi:hypothetical protein
LLYSPFCCFPFLLLLLLLLLLLSYLFSTYPYTPHSFRSWIGSIH